MMTDLVGFFLVFALFLSPPPLKWGLGARLMPADWNSSRCSSEPGDSLGDASMQAAAELNDVDMP